ncbi:hypothetical protein XFF6970_490072 [Xanthomonas citri pv. fuscans]|nr:hypothetical protein XFF6970_490072 [Xanthomonas citri pv. fuscans]
MAVGCWLLAVGCWLLAVGCYRRPPAPVQSPVRASTAYSLALHYRAGVIHLSLAHACQLFDQPARSQARPWQRAVGELHRQWRRSLCRAIAGGAARPGLVRSLAPTAG